MKKLLLLCLVLAGHTLWAQTDVPEENTTILEESTTYLCENKVTGDFQGFSPSASNTCAGKQEFKTLWYKFIPSKTATYAIAVDQLDDTNLFIKFYQGSADNLTNISSGCSTRYTQKDLTAGETYYVEILGEFPSTQFSACLFAIPEAQENDEPENAIAITASTYGVCENAITAQHAINATRSDQAVCMEDNKVDVWYAFTPSETANYTVTRELLNNYNSSKIGVYQGTPNNLTLISYADVDVTVVGCGPRVKADLNAGETYYIVFGILNTSRVTYFNLCTYKTPDAPVNDNCDNAIDLTVGGDFDKSAIVGDITSATREDRHSGPNCDYFEWVSPNGNGKDVWFTATIPASGNLIIETRPYNEAERQFLNDTGMQSFVAGTCDALEPYRFYDPGYGQEVYCNKSFNTQIIGYEFAGIRYTNKTPGDKVLVRVYPWAHEYGRFKIAAYDDSPLSVNEFDKNNFTFYPNPTTDIVNVKYANNITSLSVKNLLGKTIKTVSTNSRNVQLDLTELAAGMYIVTAKSDQNEVTNFKVVKK